METVDYSKDVQVTIEGKTFPAEVLVNDPEFGIILGFKDENGTKWIHSMDICDYEGGHDYDISVEVSNVESSNENENPEIHIGDVVKSPVTGVAIMVTTFAPDGGFTGLLTDGKMWTIPTMSNPVEEVGEEEATLFRVQLAVNTGKVLLSNDQIITLEKKKWYKGNFEGNEWIFEFDNIRDNGDIICTKAIAPNNTAIPSDILEVISFLNLHILSNFENLEEVPQQEILMKLISMIQ